MRTVLFVVTGVWHFLAFWHFTVFPERTLKRTTSVRPIAPITVELFRFLGGLNLALTVLAGWATQLPTMPALFACFAVANASQFAVDVKVHRAKLAHGPMFLQILVGDFLVGAAHLIALVYALAR